MEAREQGWIARINGGYAILRYEDCVAFLRDRRWHQAFARLSEMMGLDAGRDADAPAVDPHRRRR